MKQQDNHKKKASVWKRSISMIVFLGMFFSVAIFNFLKPQKGFSESENRFLASAPEFSWESLLNGTFTKEAEEFITDQFLFRDQFIGIKTESEHLIGKQDTNGVYFAKDGYLIEKHDSSTIEKTLLERNIQRLAEFMNTTSDLLGEEHVSVMLVPTASAILTDKLPAFATQFDQDEMLDYIKAEMINGKFVDIRTALKEHNREEIYYKTDHHWTTIGAFYAYEAWCQQMGIEYHTQEEYVIQMVSDNFYGTIYTKARLIGTKPDKIYRFTPKFENAYAVDYNLGERTENSLYAESYLSKRDQYSYFLSGNNPLVKIQSSNQNGKKLLLIKDSFAHSLAPFAANDFEEVHMVDLRYLNMSMQDYMEQNEITDVLILYNTINFATEKTLVNLNR